MLSDFDFKTDYNKAMDNIACDFYLPCIENSVMYDRITGYFSSSIYVIAWTAIKSFILNSGKMRIICSPYVQECDKFAIIEGYNAHNSSLLQSSLVTEINNMLNNNYLDKPTRALACFIAIGAVDVRIALISSNSDPEAVRLFHDKVGVFTDNNNNKVGFRGSMNETYCGLSSDGNIESIDVFPSWVNDRDRKRVESASQYFNDLWDNRIQGINVVDFPEAAKNILLANVDSDSWRELLADIQQRIDSSNKWIIDKDRGKRPRDHQLESLENWKLNGHQGIFEHATGSGKTFTAICAANYALRNQKIPIILVPSIELLNQWYEELSIELSNQNVSILVCGNNNNIWKRPGYLNSWTSPGSAKKKIIITTMDTAASKEFLSNVFQGIHLFVIADEVHRLGSKYRSNVFKLKAGYKLGLSATPIRYGDVSGTDAIFSYFGEIILPRFTLFDAIQTGVLTRYFYYPNIVHLSFSEQAEWDNITIRLKRIIAQKASDQDQKDIFCDSQIRLLLINRSRIIKNAEAKVGLATKIIKENFRIGQHWIVYCDNQNQLQSVIQQLLLIGIDAYEYHSNMNGDRGETLKYFSLNGGVVVSIRCLDEGVDIPAATHALILASSSNPREFIQRRGRILRKSSGKYFAYLYDALVVPNMLDDLTYDHVKIIESELARSIQFGEWAENPSCITMIRNIAIDSNVVISNVINGGIEDENER